MVEGPGLRCGRGAYAIRIVGVLPRTSLPTWAFAKHDDPVGKQ